MGKNLSNIRSNIRKKIIYRDFGLKLKGYVSAERAKLITKINMPGHNGRR